MIVNPPSECMRELIADAKEISRKRRIKFNDKEFRLAVAQFKRQHGHLPERISVVKVKGISDKINTLVSLGKTKNMFYTPHKGSRKNPKGNYNYRHKCDNHLVTDHSGKVLMYVGGSKVKDDGWIHD